jgi:phosphotransferase system IIB component
MIKIPVSVGELLDKLSILQVKKSKISDPDKLNYINKELELLYNYSYVFFENNKIQFLYNTLVETNSKLWNIEDEIRKLEKDKNFSEEFIVLARQVYFTNDKRFEIKNEINKLTDSEIKEVKEYVSYE